MPFFYKKKNAGEKKAGISDEIVGVCEFDQANQ